MGAGALEAPTTKLRDYPVLDVRKLQAKERAKLVALAQAVWVKEGPIDWASDCWQPEEKLRDLDEWILKTAGTDVTADQMYDDIRATCQARIVVAEDKRKKTKKQQS